MSDKPKKIIVKLPAKKTTPTGGGGRPEKVVYDKNPFKPADETPRRVKALFWGPTGVRKTRLALQFPKPCVADGEEGTKWYADEFGFDVLPFGNFAEFSAAIDWLAKGKHPYLTFVVDPSTIIWDLLQKQWSDTFLIRNIGTKGFKFDFYNMQPGDWKHVKAEWKDLLKRITALDMHVIFTARQKDLYAEGELMKKVGVIHDGEKNMPYFFDVVLHLTKNDKDVTVGVCQKDRTHKLPKGPFEVTYKSFLDAFGTKYLDRPVEPTPLPPEEEEPEQALVVEAASVEKAAIEEEYWHCADCGVKVEKRGSVGWTCESCGQQFGDVALPAEKTGKISVTLPAEKPSKPDIGGNPKGGDPEEIRAAQEKKSKEKKPGSSSNPLKVKIKKPEKKKEKPEKKFCTDQQEKDIREFCEVLGYSEKKMMAGLGAHGATAFSELTEEDATSIIEILEKQVASKR